MVDDDGNYEALLRRHGTITPDSLRIDACTLVEILGDDDAESFFNHTHFPLGDDMAENHTPKARVVVYAKDDFKRVDDGSVHSEFGSVYEFLVPIRKSLPLALIKISEDGPDLSYKIVH